jgi:hypothetical protein
MTDQTAMELSVDAAAAERQFAEIREESRAGRHYETLVVDLRALLNTMAAKRRQDLTTLAICVLLLNLPAHARAEVLAQFFKPAPALKPRRLQ